MEQQKTFTLKKLIEENIFPQGIVTLRKLVKNGARKESGEYTGNDYIIGMNVGSGKKNGIRWVVKPEEVREWLKRKSTQK